MTAPITALRMAAPDGQHMAAIRLQGQWVLVDFEYFSRLPYQPKKQPKKQAAGSASQERANMHAMLQRVLAANAPVVAGIRTRSDHRPELLWLRNGDDTLQPATRRERLQRCGPTTLYLLIAAIIICSLSAFAIFAPTDIIGSALMIVAGVIGAAFGLCCLAGAAVYGSEVAYALLSQTERDAQKALAGAFARPRATTAPAGPCPAPDKAAPPAVSTESTAIADRDEQQPALRRIHGHASSIQVTHDAHGDASEGLSTTFTYYQFMVKGQKVVAAASKDRGGNDIFLAEGDEVELIVPEPPPGLAATDTALVVLALRNCVDGQAYACHRAATTRAAMADNYPLPKTYTMIGMTPQVWRGYKRLTTTMIALIILIGALIGMATFAADDKLLFGVLALAVWAAFDMLCNLPAGLLRFKWRLGHASKRQHLTSRVYRLLGIESAARPPATLIDV